MNIHQVFTAAALLVLGPIAAFAADTDWAPVATALGKSGAEMPGGVYRVGLPRTDLHVTLDGVDIKPPWRWAPGWPSRAARTAWSWATLC